MEHDEWKEKFLLQLKEKAVKPTILTDGKEFRIWGFHFFNQEINGDFDTDFQGLTKF